MLVDVNRSETTPEQIQHAVCGRFVTIPTLLSCLKCEVHGVRVREYFSTVYAWCCISLNVPIRPVERVGYRVNYPGPCDVWGAPSLGNIK